MNITVCKYCQSPSTKKYGFYKGTQRYYCNTCRRKFSANDNLFRMRAPVGQVAAALSMYYEGMSLRAISRHIEQESSTTGGKAEFPSNKTVFEWVDRYTDDAVNATKDFHPKVGDTWIADETYVRVDKRMSHDAKIINPYSKSTKAKWVVFWDIIDADTRFLLASCATTTRTTKDAETLMRKAAERAGKLPKVVVTDKLAAYLDGIELAYGAGAKHKQGGPFDIQSNANLIERFHGTLKARTKVMRALKNRSRLEKFTNGWLVHYNYLRPHGSLEGETPAEAAGIVYPFKSWDDITCQASPQTKVLTIPAQVRVINTSPPRVSYEVSRRTPKTTAKKPTVNSQLTVARS